jgi:hypothetical protein
MVQTTYSPVVASTGTVPAIMNPSNTGSSTANAVEWSICN